MIATVAQSVEQLIRNQQVAGSSPASSSKIAVSMRYGFFFINSRQDPRKKMQVHKEDIANRERRE